MTRLQSLQRGQAMIVATMFFLTMSLLIIYGLAGPAFSQTRVDRGLFQGRESYYLAESGTEDVLYRLKNGLSVSATGQSVTVNGYSASTDITDIPGGKVITTTANWNGSVRKVEASVAQGAGIAFNYGMQAGNGGVKLGGGSSIIGNIYSNGSIDAVSASITGTAVAADSAALTADQANDAPIVPPSSITFRNASAAQDFAQSFALSVDAPINKFSFYIKKVGTPANANVIVVADNAGTPSTTQIPVGIATLSASQVTTSFGWVDVVLPSSPSLIASTTYWVIIDNGTQSSSNYYIVGANNTYAAGAAKTGSNGGTWTVTGLDSYFRVYTGGISSYIGGATYPTGFLVGTSGIGDAWATTIMGTSAQGHMYCTTGTNNNKPCDTSKGSPPPQPLPFSDANIQGWKDEARAGGTISGNYTVGSAGGSLGPKEITGTLTVNGGGTLTLTGTIWAHGAVLVTGGGSIKLASGFVSNSGTIVSDSTITVNGGGSTGSGTSGSYLFMVSTSKCPNDVNCAGVSAITISGGGGAIAANAQNGTVTLSGGAAIDAITANHIDVSGGSTVTYNSGLASPTFQSGPSGGWDIKSWKEIQ